MRIRRILCPVDFTTATHWGLVPAVTIAERRDAELIFAHAIDFPYPYMNQVGLSFDMDRYYQETEAAAEERLAELVEAEAGDVEARTLVLRGTPATAVADAVEDHDVDLVVMPTHGRTGFERMLVGSVTEKVVRLCPCPVLTVTPRDERRGGFEPRHILFPTDFSDRSDAALEHALSMARTFGASVLMLHVVTLGDEDPANPDWGFPSIPAEHLESVVEVAEEALADRRTAAEEDRVEVATRLVRGFDPAVEIDRIAHEEGCDLVVMATHGYTGLAYALLGSTAAKVVRHFDGAVLTVRPEETGSD